MLKKSYYLIPCALALCLVQNASAQPAEDVWTGLAGNGLWGDPGNWSAGVPTADESVLLAPANGSSVATIVPGEVGYAETISGPEWGMTLNIYGELHYSWYLTPVQSDPATPSTINMYGNSSMEGEGIALGYNWWWNGGPYVNMNLYGNSTVNINWFWWGGHLNLYGGTLSIANGFTDGTDGSVSDATRMMDLAGGQLILPGDATSTVNRWISRGILEGYGVLGQVAVDTTSDPDHTIVIGVVPEPASVALLGLGSCVMMLVFRRRTGTGMARIP